MKRFLFDRLRCPECKGDLELTVEEGNLDDGVVEGSLLCGCGRTYPIEKRIARLLPDKFRKI